MGLEPVHAPDQRKPGGNAPVDETAVSVTAVGFQLKENPQCVCSSEFPTLTQLTDVLGKGFMDGVSADGETVTV